MRALQVIREGFEHVHDALREDLAEVESDWLFWQPAPRLNHIGFLAWYIVRDEDQVLSHLAHEPATWKAEGWAARFAMDAESQGTGLDPERLASFRYDRDLFLAYAESVWGQLTGRLGKLSEDDLDAPAWAGSEWNVARQLVEGLLGHAWLHLGEMRCVMGLRGWRFRE
jgi:hypothetical protein